MAEDNAQVDITRLVAEYYQAVYRYAYRLSGSATEAEDLTQQVYLIAGRNMGQLRSLDSGKNWLFTILRNHYLRNRHIEQRIPTTDAPINLDHIPREIPPDIYAKLEIEPEMLQQALNSLSDISRVILGMFYYEEFSYKEIAEHLNLPLGTVMSRLARAKADLRSRLRGTKEKGIPRKSISKSVIHQG
ncbi:MAG: sigma-70 family RNA polymerase sigma factor [Pirellulales bacterium]|nr:sigma-70 family RNA polymerase sigma factor [Pirellulales bacterium]